MWPLHTMVAIKQGLKSCKQSRWGVYHGNKHNMIHTVFMYAQQHKNVNNIYHHIIHHSIIITARYHTTLHTHTSTE